MKTENENNTFFIYRSSAGSGKTHQLAIEYISMALAQPNLFNRILAVTFTNKATKEMKERILSFLTRLANKEDPDLLKQVIDKSGLDEKIIEENAKIVIGKILHQYSQFAVSTIDAFFQKVVKSFSKELGLLGNYKVELDQDKIKQELIDQIIDEIGDEKEMTDWLVEFSFTKVDANKSWNIRPQIESLANEVFKESFRTIENELDQIQQKDFKEFLKKVRNLKDQFEKSMKIRAKEAIDLIAAHGLYVDDFSYKASGAAGYFGRVIDKNDLDPKERVKGVIENPEKWYAKSSPKKQEIQQVIEAGLQEMTNSIVEYYTTHLQAYTTAVEVLRNFYVFGILSQIIHKLKQYRHEHDVMLISDVPVFLKGIIAENEAPFIYEKTGSWYQHYLIDEFQDTSGFQWNNFKPLIENGLAQGNASLLVGDGKQSVYRWRGGDWNLILHKVKADLLTWNPEEKHLNINWRSSRKIVEFNNEVFDYLPSFLNSHFNVLIESLNQPDSVKANLYAMASDLKGLYEDVFQQVASKNMEPSAGVIEINAYQKDAENPWKESVLNELPLKIERLQDAGFEARDIAILVRKSDEGKQVIEQLIKYKHSDEATPGYCYDAISNESLFLGNASVIRLLINTIKYALNPQDRIAFAEICYNYQYLRNGTKMDSNGRDLQFIMDGASLPEGFSESLSLLIQRPVYEMIECIIQLFDLSAPEHKGYLQAFQDIVLEYFANESKDINDFLEWWQEKGQRKSIQMPDSINAIRVMTIHKSKGLEFKAVLVPFCDWKMDHDAKKDTILWCKTEQEPFNGIGYLPLKYNKKLGESFFAAEYFEEMIKAFIDNLNLLYVALTRAEKFLMVNCPPASKEIANAGDLVVKSIEKISADATETGNVAYSSLDGVIQYSIGKLPDDHETFISEDKNSVNTGYESSDWREKIAVRKKGSLIFDHDSIEKNSKINYGLLVHEILAGIENEKEVDALVEKYFLEGEISADDRITLIEQIKTLFSNPHVQSWFNTDWEVKAETPIITSQGQPKRPDRVLLSGDKAIIIDFKTGMEKDADTYQVVSYAKLLNEMGYAKTEAYLLYIATNKVKKIV